MMGRELEPINQVPCGNIVAIGGLENLILKSATLSSTIFCPSFSSMHMQTSPIVRVAIEPKNPCKLFTIWLNKTQNVWLFTKKVKNNFPKIYKKNYFFIKKIL